jgi:hypothetical protein
LHHIFVPLEGGCLIRIQESKPSTVVDLLKIQLNLHSCTVASLFIMGMSELNSTSLLINFVVYDMS